MEMVVTFAVYRDFFLELEIGTGGEVRSEMNNSRRVERRESRESREKGIREIEVGDEWQFGERRRGK